MCGRWDECHGAGMSDTFQNRITATTIVNQAVMKCLLLGIPANADNIVRLIGDFFDPQNPDFGPLVDELMIAINEVAALSVGRSELNH